MGDRGLSRLGARVDSLAPRVRDRRPGPREPAFSRIDITSAVRRAWGTCGVVIATRLASAGFARPQPRLPPGPDSHVHGPGLRDCGMALASSRARCPVPPIAGRRTRAPECAQRRRLALWPSGRRPGIERAAPPASRRPRIRTTKKRPEGRSCSAQTAVRLRPAPPDRRSAAEPDVAHRRHRRRLPCRGWTCPSPSAAAARGLP